MMYENSFLIIRKYKDGSGVSYEKCIMGNRCLFKLSYHGSAFTRASPAWRSVSLRHFGDRSLIGVPTGPRLQPTVYPQV